MEKFYTDERSIQIVLALLKAHKIRKVVVSPGTTNLTLVGSMQSDPFFEIYSSVDERSAAYLACGLSAESKEPVILSCTGATASRNYMSGLTEAFYRKLPILVITSHQGNQKIGHLIPQNIDRTSLPNDIVKFSTTIDVCKDNEDIWAAEISANKAVLELTRNGGGPVHINLVTRYSKDFSVKELPKVRVINRITFLDSFPNLSKDKRIAIFCGAHKKFSDKEIEAIEKFCESRNAVVFCDHTSGYYGKYAVHHSLAIGQTYNTPNSAKVDLLIHIGEVSGDYDTKIRTKETWRVSEDGELRDTFRSLKNIFQMPELYFFSSYATDDKLTDSFLDECKRDYLNIYNKIPELKFSNIWIAKNSIDSIPENSVVHFGILNSLRSWNFFKFKTSVESYCNVGGFGIDGILSSTIGGALTDSNRLHFVILGDLAFFYDMNALGNRYLPKNIRILLVNNGKGTEFTNYNHPGSRFGEKCNEYIAAAGHYGNKSKTLVKNYAEALGFEYMSASTKDEYIKIRDSFFDAQHLDKPMLLEVFTDSEDESNALKTVREIDVPNNIKTSTIKMAKNIFGEEAYTEISSFIKKMIH